MAARGAGAAGQPSAAHRCADESICRPAGRANSLCSVPAGLQEAGWAVGRNARIDVRWGGADAGLLHTLAMELLALAPDIIMAGGTLTMLALQQVRTVPIVFAGVGDPVGAGFVDSLARPGGNVTGFMNIEFSFAGKWLELLKEIAPSVKRAAVLRNAANPSGIAQFTAIQTVAPSLGVEVSAVNVNDAGEIERAVAAVARSANGGLVVTTSASATVHHGLIIALAAQHKLPAVYGNPVSVMRGGLIAYGPDFTDEYRRAAGYVDRILKGEKAANLPVQAPTQYELAINLKTAKALGLDLPTSTLARADEVIE